MKEKIKKFIMDRFKPDHDLEFDEQLITTNIIDSFGTLELAEFIEAEYGLSIPDQDLVPDKIGTINLIVAHIEANQK